MHAVLRTAELRALIFEELPRRSLAALARSCKDLSLSALAVLWYELRNLQPVYRLLPESKRVIEGELEYITPRDVGRVRYYRDFVRRLTFPLLPAVGRLSPSALRQIIVALDEEFLFPHLRYLDYTGPSEYFSTFPALIPHSLTSLHLNIEGEWYLDDTGLSTATAMEVVTLMMAKVRRRNISALSLRLPPEMPIWPVAEILTGWHGLRTLTVMGQIDEKTLAAIHALPLLHSLTLLCHPREFLPFCRTERKSCSLRTAKIHVPTMTDAAAALALNSPPDIDPPLHLQTLTVWPENPENMEYLGKQLRNHCSVDDLQSFIVQWNELSSVPYAVVVTMQDLRPLLDFVNLRHVRVDLNCRLDLSNGDLEAMAHAWPQIRTLHLEGTRLSTSSCTLDGLLPFAHHCKNLEQLAVKLQSGAVVLPTKKPDIVHLGLRDIDFLDSPIKPEERPKAAAFLAMHFPSNMLIRSSYGERGWDDVMYIYPTFIEFARVYSA
ncbi:hypothetical protein FB107DRAFT_204530 [Schizophyllum commune]